MAGLGEAEVCKTFDGGLVFTLKGGKANMNILFSLCLCRKGTGSLQFLFPGYKI